MGDIFVSYKAEDRDRVRPLVEALQAAGFSTWWDVHLGGGNEWREEIEWNLDAAKCVIVAWSKRAVSPEGRFVRDEASRAQRKGTYLPVRIDDVDLPLGFGETQAFSLVGWKGKAADPRFQAIVDAVTARIEGGPVAMPVAQPASQPAITRRAAMAGAGVAAVALAGGAGYWLLGSKAEDRRIAVMPFENLSSDPAQSFFSKGIADEIRTSLMQAGFQVTGQTSSEAVKGDEVTAAAARLDVANILTGSVKREKEVVRITARLVDGSNGLARWTQTYDRIFSEAIMLQTEIASAVARTLNIVLGDSDVAAMTLGGTDNPEAQNILLQARESLREDDSPEGHRRSLELADKAIALDPDFGRAQVMRARLLSNLASMAYSSTAFEAELKRAREAAELCVRKFPKMGSAFSALAGVSVMELEFGEATAAYKQALQLSPDDSQVLRAAAVDLGHLTEPGNYLEMAKRAVAIDPLNANCLNSLASVLDAMGRYPEALAAVERAGKLDPKNGPTKLLRSTLLARIGQYSRAMTVLKSAMPDEVMRRSFECWIAAKSGNSALARKLLAAGLSMGGNANYMIASIHALLREWDTAFELLDRAVRERDMALLYLKHDQDFEPVRKDPRFVALLKRLKFPS